jgi:hypothetical protein
LLVSEAEVIATADPQKAALMLADAVGPLVGTGHVPSVLAVARRADALAKGCNKAVQAYASLSLGLALVLSGQAKEGYLLILR